MSVTAPPPTVRPESQREVEPSARARPTPVAAIVPLAGFLCFLGLAVVLDPTRGHLSTDVSLALFAAAVTACALLATGPVALLLATCAWLDYDGFVVGRDGTLSWHGGTDGVRLGVLLGCAVAAVLVRRLRRSRARHDV